MKLAAAAAAAAATLSCLAPPQHPLPSFHLPLPAKPGSYSSAWHHHTLQHPGGRRALCHSHSTSSPAFEASLTAAHLVLRLTCTIPPGRGKAAPKNKPRTGSCLPAAASPPETSQGPPPHSLLPLLPRSLPPAALPKTLSHHTGSLPSSTATFRSQQEQGLRWPRS